MAYISGNANYPTDYDINPVGTGTANLFFVLDEIRDSNGVVIQSGNPVIARDMNAAYAVIDKIERTLGQNPAGGYDSIAERVNFMEYSGNLAFIPVTGGRFIGTGELTAPTAFTINITKLKSSGLDWMLLNNSTLNSSGNFSLGASGTVSIGSSSFIVTGTTIQALGTNLTLNASNYLSIYSSQTNVSGSLIPVTGDLVDLGSPTSYYKTLYVGDIKTTGASSSIVGFIPESGGSMFGGLSITGINGLTLGTGNSILVYESGSNEIGSAAYPFSGVYTQNLYATDVTGLSSVRFHANVEFTSGTIIASSGSGVSIGTPAEPIDVIYTTSIVGPPTIDLEPFAKKSGCGIYGNITFTGNANIVLHTGSSMVVDVSGVGAIGISGTPIGDIWADRINGRKQAGLVFNEQLGGVVDGVNTGFTFAHPPVTGTAMIFVSGLYMRPTYDYIITGSMIQMVTHIPSVLSGPPWAGYYIY